MASPPPGALIVGGGIAGLASALALARLGWRCTILEKDSRRRRAGQGLLLPRCGRHALERLGVDDIASDGCPIDAFQLDARDGTAPRSFAIPGALALLHRDLIERLSRALPATVALLGHVAAGLEPGPAGSWRVVGCDGQRWSADLIVAADGVGSLCRRNLFPGASLTPEQVTELVLVTPAPALVQQLAGTCRKIHDREAGLALGVMPCRDGQLLLYAQIATARHTISGLEATGAFLRRHFRGWIPPLDGLLDGPAGDRAHMWRTTDLDPLPRLHHGNAVLVGDSGHPLLPFTSQGVASALEDALELGAALAGVDPGEPAALAAALARYSSRRLPVVTRLLQEGRETRRQFLTATPGAERCRPPLVGFELECSGSR